MVRITVFTLPRSSGMHHDMQPLLPCLTPNLVLSVRRLDAMVSRQAEGCSLPQGSRRYFAYKISNTASTSTATPVGNAANPTALLA